jgi:hypothetical protein
MRTKEPAGRDRPANEVSDKDGDIEQIQMLRRFMAGEARVKDGGKAPQAAPSGPSFAPAASGETSAFCGIQQRRRKRAGTRTHPLGVNLRTTHRWR